MGLLRRLVTAALVVGVVAVAFVAVANWRADGAFSLRVFDPQWWGVGRQKAQPYLDQAEATTKEAYDALWGAGGLVDQAQRWVAELRARRAQPPASPAVAPAAGAVPPGVVKSSATRAVEQRLEHAEDLFQQGVQHYQAGNPTQGGFSEAKKRELADAKRCFADVRDILDRDLDAYERSPDHDAGRAADARRMQKLDRELLFNAGKMGGGA